MLTRRNPGTLTIPQYQINKIKQHTLGSSFPSVLNEFATLGFAEIDRFLGLFWIHENLLENLIDGQIRSSFSEWSFQLCKLSRSTKDTTLSRLSPTVTSVWESLCSRWGFCCVYHEGPGAIVIRLDDTGPYMPRLGLPAIVGLVTFPLYLVLLSCKISKACPTLTCLLLLL